LSRARAGQLMKKHSPKTISQGPEHCPINSAKATGMWRQIRPK
jgi:hypothetical protein